MNRSHEVPARDSLAATLDEVSRWLDEHGLRKFWGSVDLSGEEVALRSATWNPAMSSNWGDFLTLAKDLGASVVFIDSTVFKLDDFLRTRDFPETDEVQALVKLLRSHDGELIDLELQWMWGQVLMRAVHLAAWHRDLEELEGLSEDEDEDECEDGDEETLDDKEIERRALVLAKDPPFQAAKSNAQRAYSARKLFADDPIEAPRDLMRVVEEAKSIYEVEIKPRVHDELIRKIETLKESGATRAKIAIQLGLSSEKVKDLGG